MDRNWVVSEGRLTSHLLLGTSVLGFLWAALEKVLQAAASLAPGYICLLYNYIFSALVLLTW